MKIRVGFGATVMYRGLRLGNLDGIGYYTQNLIEQFSHLDDRVALEKLIFGKSSLSNFEYENVYNAPSYGSSALMAATSGVHFKLDSCFENKLDLFHSPDHYTPKLKNTPVIATLMDAIPLSNPNWSNPRFRRLKNWIWRKSGSWADRVITISNYSKGQINYYFNIPEEKISVIPLGVDRVYFERIDEVLKKGVLELFDIPTRFFLFVGTLQERKNIEKIIAAHQCLPLKVQRDIPLIIVGSASSNSGRIASSLSKNEWYPNIRWLRRVDDFTKRVLMQQATAIVFASLSEGFGLPVLEGFASKTPVITSNSTSLSEVGADAALLVDPNSVPAIAEAMFSLAKDTNLANDLRMKGVERAQSFSWDECALKTIKVYKKAIYE